MKYLILLMLFSCNGCSNKYQKGFNVNVLITLNNGVSISPSSEICNIETELGKIYFIFCHKATLVRYTLLTEISGLDFNFIHATANYERIYVELNDSFGPLDPDTAFGSFRLTGSFDSETFKVN